MKNLVTGFLFLITTSLMSQIPGRLELGGYLGFENDFVSCNNPVVIDRYRSLPGFNIGLRGEYHFNKTFSIVAGIEYTNMQFKFVPPAHPDSSVFWPSGTLKYDMARFPLLFQLSLGSKRSRFLFNVGPSIILTYPDRNNADAFGSIPDIISTINLGGNVGLGYAYFPTNWFKVYVETFCGVPLIGTPYSAYTTPTSVRLIGFGGRVGVSFRLTKLPDD